MADKNVEDYLTEGIYGPRETKPSERRRFLGTIRERIVLALTKGELMSDKGLNELEEAMKSHQEARLLINGNVSYKFSKNEKALARKYNITYTEITNKEAETDIGAVLTYDYAIDKESIFLEDMESEETEAKEKEEEPAANESFFDKLKRWLS